MEPKTVVEKLDAAETGEEFGRVLTEWIDILRRTEIEDED